MSDLDQHDDISDLLAGASAPELRYDLDATLRTGRRVRARRRLVAAGGGLIGIAAAATALALTLPGSPSASVAPAGGSLSVSSSPSSLADTQCFPSDPSVPRTPWLTATAPGTLPKGGPVTVTAEILAGCPNNVLSLSESPEGKGATEVTLGLTQRPTSASWVVANAAVLILPKGQRPCGYSFADALPEGVTVNRGEWDVVVQPIEPSLLNKAASGGTVDVCEGGTVVARDLPQLGAQDQEAESEFNERQLSQECDLDQLGTAADSARAWASHTEPDYLGKADVAVEVRTHPGAGCTGEGVTTGPIGAGSSGMLLEVDVPEAPTTAFWDLTSAGDRQVAAFFLPAGQEVCDIDFSGSGLEGRPTLQDATKVSLDNGWTLELQPLPDTNRPSALRARVCTAAGVVTPSLAPLTAG